MSRITSEEKLVIAIFIALVIHVITISTVSFSPPQYKKSQNSTMDIILVQKSTLDTIEDADYLAQVNQEGGGEAEDKARPSTPTPAPIPDVEANMVVTPAQQQRAIAQQQAENPLLTSQRPSDYQVANTEQRHDSQETAEAGETLETIETNSADTTQQLIATTQADIASIQAEIDERFNALAKRPRHDFISARTKSYKYASYMDEWRIKIEEIGDSYYPAEAKRRKLSGSLILDVAINADGTIYKVSVNCSSGHRILDNAAKRIVHLAAPFKAFPKDIRKNVDILHITRTWKFINDNVVNDSLTAAELAQCNKP